MFCMLQVDKQYRSIMRTVHGRPGALQVWPRGAGCELASCLCHLLATQHACGMTDESCAGLL